MKRWLLIIGFLLVVILGALFLLRKDKGPAEAITSTPDESATATPEVKNLITLTSSGFSPISLTVKIGDTVTWLNNDGIIATVNSDPHPVHTEYEPLNLGNFTKGKTHTLTFPTPGTYGYHNHFNPNQRGTIIVE